MDQILFFILIDSALFLLPVGYVAFAEKKKINLKTIFTEFGLAKFDPAKDFILFLKILGSLFLVSLILSAMLYLLGLSDFEPVEEAIFAIAKLNPLIIIYLFVVRIFAEEFFFRSFLVPRTGILVSSILFGALHFGYGSFSEMAGAFVLGLVLAYFYDKYRKILPNYAAHIAYNLVTILLVLL